MAKMIMAVDAEGGIGKNDRLPWHIPSEFKYFKQYTNGCLCIMGRKTYEDVKSFKKQTTGPFLVGRSSVVISTDIRALRRANNHSDIVFNDNPYYLMDLLYMAKKEENSKMPTACIIGGKSIYELFTAPKDIVDEISITYIDETYNCDTFIDVDELLEGFSPVSEVDGNGWKAVVYRRDIDEDE